MIAANKLSELNDEHQLNNEDQPERIQNENSFSSKMVSKFKVNKNMIIIVNILIEFLRYIADIQNRSYEDWEQPLMLKLKIN